MTEGLKEIELPLFCTTLRYVTWEHEPTLSRVIRETGVCSIHVFCVPFESAVQGIYHRTTQRVVLWVATSHTFYLMRSLMISS
jgi:hypothetical protein